MVTRSMFKVALLALGIMLMTSVIVFAQDASAVIANDVPKPKLITDTAIGEALSTYTLGKGDVVNISVRNQPEFSGEFVVGPDGKIQYAFVGDLEGEGLTKEQLKQAVEKKLEKFVKGADVSVTISANRSKFVYELGEVHSPGKYPMKGDKVSLREAVVAAGLPTPFAALRRIYVINPHELLPKARKIDLYRVLYKGILKDDIDLTPGDLVVIPSTVPSEINRALTNLLSPLSQAVDAASMYKILTGD